MYRISLDKYLKILNWNVIYWGIKNDIIKADSAIDYANTLIENEPDKENPLIIELLITDDTDKNFVLNLISHYINTDNKKEKNAQRILKYIILDSIKNSGESISNVLNCIEDVYTDFGYPSDMAPFIGYMPAEDSDYNPAEYTQEENEKRLIGKLNTFLETEFKEIISTIN